MRRTSVTFSLILGLLVLAGPALAGPAMETMLEADFDVRAGGRLTVDVPDAGITVHANGGDQVTIEVKVGAGDRDRARERYEEMNFRAGATGSDVTLEADSISSWNWGSHGSFRVEVEIGVPDQFDLDLRTGDGDMRVDRVTGVIELVSGDGDVMVESLGGPSISVRTGDGDIGLKDLDARTVEVRTGDGDVHSESIDADEIRVRTGDGDIRLDRVSGALTASTGDGDIVVDLDRVGETSLRSGDGDITIRTAASTQATLALHGESVVMRDTAGFDGQRSDEMAEGDWNGGGPTLEARTSDGTIVFGDRG